MRRRFVEFISDADNRFGIYVISLSPLFTLCAIGLFGAPS